MQDYSEVAIIHKTTQKQSAKEQSISTVIYNVRFRALKSRASRLARIISSCSSAGVSTTPSSRSLRKMF